METLTVKLGDKIVVTPSQRHAISPVLGRKNEQLHKVTVVAAKTFFTGHLRFRYDGTEYNGNATARIATKADLGYFDAKARIAERKEAELKAYNEREDVVLVRGIGNTFEDTWSKLPIEQLRQIRKWIDAAERSRR